MHTHVPLETLPLKDVSHAAWNVVLLKEKTTLTLLRQGSATCHPSDSGSNNKRIPGALGNPLTQKPIRLF
jgi:hypothetical protein